MWDDGVQSAHGPVRVSNQRAPEGVTHVGMWTFDGGARTVCWLYPRNDVEDVRGTREVLLEPAIANTADNQVVVSGRNHIPLAQPVEIQPGEYAVICHWYGRGIFPLIRSDVAQDDPAGRYCWNPTQDDRAQIPDAYPPEDLLCGRRGFAYSMYILGDTLAAPACDDGLQNGDESDVDCGGTCAGCDDGSACALDADCASDVCEAGACVAGPSCDDGVQNGNEIGVDCGGDCAACPPDGSRVGNVDLGNITGLGSPTGWLAFYTPDQQVELTHIGIDIPSVNGDYQFQCFVYSRDPNVVDDNTFRRDLFDGVIGRTEPVPVRRAGDLYLALEAPVVLDPVEYGLGCVLTGAGQQIVLAIDRLGDRRYCYINGGQFPFNGDVPPGEWRCGQPNVRVGIFGVINDDFVGAACDDGIQNGDETGVDCGGSCDACNQDVACREDADCAAGESCIAELCRDGAVRAGATRNRIEMQPTMSRLGLNSHMAQSFK